MLTGLVACTQTFYKLVGNSVVATSTKESVPFLTQSFFTCESDQDCTNVVKIVGNSKFKEAIGQQTVKEDKVVYRKVNTQERNGMFDFELLHCVIDSVCHCIEFIEVMLTLKSYGQGSVIREI